MSTAKILASQNNERLGEEEEEDEEELENLEEEVNQMAEKVAEYRATLPDQLKATLASVLAAQRPVLEINSDFGSQSRPGSSDSPSSDLGHVESETVGNLTKEGQEELKKVQLLKEKITSNANAIPVVLNRMKECMARFDKLESHNGNIHPAFKRKRTS